MQYSQEVQNNMVTLDKLVKNAYWLLYNCNMTISAIRDIMATLRDTCDDTKMHGCKKYHKVLNEIIQQLNELHSEALNIIEYYEIKYQKRLNRLIFKKRRHH